MTVYTQTEVSRFNGEILFPKIILIKPQSKFFTTNTIIFDDNTKLVIDAGFQHGMGQLEAVRDFFDINSADLLFFSHYHIDHIVGCRIFSKSRKAIHFSEKDALKNEKTFLDFCYQSTQTPYEYETWTQRFLEFLNYDGVSGWSDFALDAVESINPKHSLHIGEKSLELLHLPGHSPGHCGIYDPESLLLFIADIDMRSFGPWYGWKNANLTSYRKSVNFLEGFVKAHDISVIVPSHSSPMDKQECLKRLSEFKKFFDKRNNLILDFIKNKKGVTLEEIVEQSFVHQGRKSDPQFINEVFERHHVEHHLEELLRENEIQLDNDRFYVI
ncbi:MAG: MBL fold metallo-hydrolase [Candidatus Hodarchaeales archaeon]|jgi:glyoxylase-like metal-dependent hydrolase (beta-lactamase superfamily II)